MRLSAEAEDRARRTNELLRAEGILTTEVLPILEPSTEARLRTPAEVAARFCALMLVAFKGATDDHESAEILREELADRAKFSPAELVFLGDPNPSERDRIQSSWRCEAALPLAWALGKLDLHRADRSSGVIALGELIFEDGGVSFSDNPQLREIGDILDATDLAYRQHWAVRQSRLNGKPVPGNLDPGVVQERHQALNWLTCYGDDDWDEVATDT